MKFRILFAAALLAATASSHAQTGYGLTASAGTTGVGLHVSRALLPNLNARIGGNFLRYSDDVRANEVDWDLELRLRTVDALLDYFPTGSQFRLTGGLVYNGNDFEGNARPSAAGTLTLNGRTYAAATVGAVRTEVDFRRIAPYLGVGWGNGASGQKGWSFAADLGVLFQGTPRSSVTNTGCTGSALLCAQIGADAAAENQRLREELKDFRYAPVVRIGATYRF